MDNQHPLSGLQHAIHLAKAGEREKARKLFLEIVRASPQNQSAWFWLVEVTDSHRERISILERCLAANPGNERVKKALAKLIDAAAEQDEIPDNSEAGELVDGGIVNENEDISKESSEMSEQHEVDRKPAEFIDPDKIYEHVKTETKKTRWWINLVSGLMLIALIAVAIVVLQLWGKDKEKSENNLSSVTVEKDQMTATENKNLAVEPGFTQTTETQAETPTPIMTETEGLVEEVETESVVSPTVYVPVRTATVLASPTHSPLPAITFNLLRSLEGAAPIAVNPIGNIIASIKPNRDTLIQLWDPSSGEAVRQFGQDDHAVRCMAFSADGKVLATGGEDNEVQMWEVSTGNLLGIFVRHTDFLFSIAFSPDNRMAASSDRSQTILFWIVQDRDIVHQLDGLKERVYGVVFSPDGALLASAGGDGAVRLWRVSDGEQAKVLVGHADAVRSVAFRKDGSILASGSGLYGTDQSVWLWNIEEGDGRKLSPDARQPVMSVAFSPDGQLLAAGAGGDGEGNGILVWHVDSGSLLLSLDVQEPVKSVAFSTDGSILIVATDDRILEFSLTFGE